MITPGSWRACSEIVLSDADIDGNIVCLAPTSWLKASLKHWPDNARLIAAAPRLLEALQPFTQHSSSEAVITITVRTADVNRARAAILEATS